MDGFRFLVTCGLLGLLTACGGDQSKAITGDSVGDVITNMVTLAQAGETNSFAAVLEPGGDLQVTQLPGMIQRSGLLTNYPGRVQMQSATKVRLDYHDLQRRCHFQVELESNGKIWSVTRIWFCR